MIGLYDAGMCESSTCALVIYLYCSLRTQRVQAIKCSAQTMSAQRTERSRSAGVRATVVTAAG